MEIKRKRKHKVTGIAAGIFIILYFSLELRPVRICSSSIFTTPENTEIKINVLVNTLLPMDEEDLIKEIICEEQKINGVRENPIYKVNLYRTWIHYQNGREYDSLNCDENGVIICDKTESVL